MSPDRQAAIASLRERQLGLAYHRQHGRRRQWPYIVEYYERGVLDALDRYAGVIQREELLNPDPDMRVVKVDDRIVCYSWFATPDQACDAAGHILRLQAKSDGL